MGYDSTPTTRFIYTCPHTGEQFEGSSLADAEYHARTLSPNCNGALESGNISVLTGKPSDQVGSQFWMDANPQGEMINVSDQVKAVCDDASYAASWANADMASLKASGVQVSTAVNQVLRYPTTVGTAEVWKAIPQLKPTDPAASNPVAYNMPVNSPGSTSEPAYVMAHNAVTSGTVLNDQSTAGTGSTGSGAVSTATDALKSIPMWLIGVAFLAIIALAMFGGRISSGVRA